MQLFVQFGIKQPELHSLNLCRMYLRVFLLSDIVSGAGDSVLPLFWDHPTPADSELQWPRSTPPSKQAWSQWRMTLTLVLHLGQHQHLALPLGPWLPQTNPNGWFYHPETNSLWEARDAQWTRHGGIPQRTRQQSFHSVGEHMVPPPLSELEKASVSHLGQKVILTGSSACLRADRNQDFCQKQWDMEFSQQWDMSVCLMGSQSVLLDALTQGWGYAVSDGSFKDNNGSAAWIIEGHNSTQRLVGQVRTLGHPGDHSSFRSKVAGIIGVLYTLTFWPPCSGKPDLRLACDGLSVVKRLTNQKPIEPTEPHADILLAA